MEFEQLVTMNVGLDEIRPHLSERGALEWNLAVERARVYKLARIVGELNEKEKTEATKADSRKGAK